MGGIEAKQLGLDLVESHNQTFVETMRSYARMIALEHGSVTTDDLREVSEKLGIYPDHKNAWGAVFRGKRWAVVGFEPSRILSNHARVIRRWRLK